jgi:branched-subunit amino acid aminotransferase/4-amino-4-deoxychorismate lyase
MTEETSSPQSSTFTTLPWDGGRRVSLFDAHLERLEEHAGRLGLAWPSGSEESVKSAVLEAMREALESPPEKPDKSTIGFLTVRLNGVEEFTAEARWVKEYPNPLTATAVAAPRWGEGVTGTKHADWKPYSEAAKLAAERGCDIALLVDGDVVVDCCRATPLLLDDDGTAWYPDPALGSIESVTLRCARTHLEAIGIPLSSGRLTKTLFSRARSFVAVGTGVGAIRIASLDGQPIGDDSSLFPTRCAEAVEKAFSESWLQIPEE